MNKIICPNCGYEYAPQEIFLMNTFNKSNIIRDEEGKILDDLNYDDEEFYKCDGCNKTFYVKMNIDFDVSMSSLTEHVTKLHKPSLFLAED